MIKGKILILGLIGILVLVVAASGCTSNTSSNTQTGNTSPTASASYKTITVGGLKCEIDSSQAGGQINSLSGRTSYISPGGSLEIEVYTDPNRYQDVINFVADEPGTNQTIQTISGHQVTSYSTTMITGKNYITYFFEVAGKQIRIIQGGTSINNHLVESFYNLN
jgi:hypothetical protein